MLYEIYPQAVAGSEAGGHRALVFAQSRALLDLVEADVLRRCARDRRGAAGLAAAGRCV